MSYYLVPHGCGPHPPHSSRLPTPSCLIGQRPASYPCMHDPNKGSMHDPPPPPTNPRFCRDMCTDIHSCQSCTCSNITRFNKDASNSLTPKSEKVILYIVARSGILAYRTVGLHGLRSQHHVFTPHHLVNFQLFFCSFKVKQPIFLD